MTQAVKWAESLLVFINSSWLQKKREVLGGRQGRMTVISEIKTRKE